MDCALLLAGCAHAPAPDLAAGEVAIRKADTAWVEAAKLRKAKAWTAFDTDHAIMLQPSEKVATTKDAVLKAIQGMMALTIVWQPAKVVMAQFREFGYLYGSHTLSYKDDKLTRDALRAAGVRTTHETVELGLHTFVRLKR